MSRLSEIPKDQYLIIYCNVGGLAKITSKNLKKAGYKRYMNWGGISRWEWEKAVSVNQVLAQVAQKDNDAGKPIPSEVKIIIEKSCPGCHTEPGNIKALSHINFSKWDNYLPEIQAAKAIEIW